MPNPMQAAEDGSKVLPNHRHELYSQELAKGISCDRAYIIAGYRPSHANAHTLRNKKDIQARVRYLLTLREEIHGQATAKAIEETALTKAWVISNLRENALKCLGKIPINVSIIEGEPPIQEFQYHPTGANRALELLGRELNMFIERHEVGDPGEFARMTDDELGKLLIEQARDLGLPESAVMKLVTDRSSDTVN
jgi:hypothetical protein